MGIERAGGAAVTLACAVDGKRRGEKPWQIDQTRRIGVVMQWMAP